MFKTRLLSGILLVIAALVTVCAGGNVLLLTMLAVSLIGMSELYKVFDIHKKLPGICGYVFAVIYYFLLFGQNNLAVGVDWFVMFFVAYMICLMAIMVIFYPKYNTEQIFTTFFGFFYVTVMLSYLYRTRLLSDGIFTVWLVFICSWGCDTCAYCFGMLFGKHKMAPKLSPKKSVEGGIGGILGSVFLAVIYGITINHFGGAGVNPISFAVIGAAAGTLSQIGDLAASAIKRFHDIKDYGKLIPGHGGILDRFDSAILTAPVIYYLAVLLPGGV